MALWWEKTVEYKFVIDYRDKFNFAPLDGNYEVIGDTILEDENSKFLLIEFKRSDREIASERNKYDNYNKDDFCKKVLELGTNDNHHCFIYGIDIPFLGFRLLCETYFNQDSIDIDDFLDNGISKKDFIKYIEFIIEEKNSGSFSGGFSYASVVCVNENGSCMLGLEEVAKVWEINLELKSREVSRKVKSKGRGPTTT